jgi:hypothetical protein
MMETKGRKKASEGYGGNGSSGPEYDFVKSDKSKARAEDVYDKSQGVGGKKRYDVSGSKRRDRFLISQREGESDEQYNKRIIAYCSNLIETIAVCEAEIKKERFRELLPFSKTLLIGNKNNGVYDKLDLVVQSLKGEIKKYLSKFPYLKSKELVNKKLSDLESLI